MMIINTLILDEDIIVKRKYYEKRNTSMVIFYNMIINIKT